MFDVHDSLVAFLDTVAGSFPDVASFTRLRISAGYASEFDGSLDAAPDAPRPYVLSEQIGVVEQMIEHLIVAPALAACALPLQREGLGLGSRPLALRAGERIYEIRVREGSLEAALEFKRACARYLDWLKNEPDPDPDMGPGSPPNDDGPIGGGNRGQDELPGIAVADDDVDDQGMDYVQPADDPDMEIGDDLAKESSSLPTLGMR